MCNLESSRKCMCNGKNTQERAQLHRGNKNKSDSMGPNNVICSSVGMTCHNCKNFACGGCLRLLTNFMEKKFTGNNKIILNSDIWHGHVHKFLNDCSSMPCDFVGSCCTLKKKAWNCRKVTKAFEIFFRNSLGLRILSLNESRNFI